MRKLLKELKIKFWGYTLYGDGIHDDTEALQAYINGDKVRHRWKKLDVSSDLRFIPSGTFLIKGAPIRLTTAVHVK